MGYVEKWYASLSDPPLERNECTPLTISPFSLPIDMIVVTGDASLDTDIKLHNMSYQAHITLPLNCNVK